MQAFTLAIVFGALVAITIAGGPPTEEMKKNLEECKAQENASEEDVQLFKSFKIPQSPSGKCLLACVFEKSGKIKDGKVNGEALKAALMRDHSGDERSVNEVIATCAGITNPQRCELAAQAMECVHKLFAKNQPK